MAVIGPVTAANGKRYARSVATFTRPADTNVYADGDLVANSTTAASVTVMSFTYGGNNTAFEFPIVRLQKSGTTATNASFRLRLYSTAPTVATVGDNGVYATNVAGFASMIGYYDGTLIGHSDGCSGFLVPETGVIKPEYLGHAGTVYGLLEARAAYTPSSGEIFIATLVQEFSI